MKVECSCPVPYEMAEETASALVKYLLELIARIERGEVKHVSVSVHPK